MISGNAVAISVVVSTSITSLVVILAMFGSKAAFLDGRVAAVSRWMWVAGGLSVVNIAYILGLLLAGAPYHPFFAALLILFSAGNIHFAAVRTSAARFWKQLEDSAKRYASYMGAVDSYKGAVDGYVQALKAYVEALQIQHKSVIAGYEATIAQLDAEIAALRSHLTAKHLS